MPITNNEALNKTVAVWMPHWQERLLTVFTIRCVTSCKESLSLGIPVPLCDRSGPAAVKWWLINAATYLPSASNTPSQPCSSPGAATQVKPPPSTPLLYMICILMASLCIQKLWFVCLSRCLHINDIRRSVAFCLNRLPTKPRQSHSDSEWDSDTVPGNVVELQKNTTQM